jgi:hypothetical protein
MAPQISISRVKNARLYRPTSGCTEFWRTEAAGRRRPYGANGQTDVAQ